MSLLEALPSTSFQRIGAIVDRVQDVGHAEAEPLSVYLDRGVVKRSDHADNHNVLGSDLAKYQRVEPGDLVFNRLRTWQGGFGASRYEGIVSPAYIVLRPRDADARYLDYVLHSAPYLAELTRLSKWMPPSQFDILWTDLRMVPIPQVPVEDQRRIADFLDDRVARIDQIIAARREQVNLSAQIPWIEFGTDVVSAPQVPLRRAICALADGPFGSAFSSSDYVDVGPAVIRLGNIGFGQFRPADLARIPATIYERFPNAHVRTGDLLIASLGDAKNHAGRACVAPDSLGAAMVKGKCFVGRATESVATERFLAVLLSSPIGAEALVQQGTGATRSMLNFERFLSCRLPMPSRTEQDSLLRSYKCSQERSVRAVSSLTRSIGLLTEYKSSLITAAVTGELDVTTAGSGIPA